MADSFGIGGQCVKNYKRQDGDHYYYIDYTRFDLCSSHVDTHGTCMEYYRNDLCVVLCGNVGWGRTERNNHKEN